MKAYQGHFCGAGGAGSLPGMIDAYTHLLFLAVPVRLVKLNGLDSLSFYSCNAKLVAVGTLPLVRQVTANDGC